MTEKQKYVHYFRVGDLVMLRSGSPAMVVRATGGTENTPVIYTLWYNPITGAIERSEFHSEVLQKVPTAPQSAPSRFGPTS